MKLIVNGTGRTLPDGVTVAEVVPRGGWPATELHDGDRVEVLSAAQGG